jgi:hypothetical protein
MNLYPSKIKDFVVQFYMIRSTIILLRKETAMNSDLKSISVLLSQEDYAELKAAADSINRRVGPLAREGIAFIVWAAKMDLLDKNGKLDFVRTAKQLSQNGGN